MAKHNLPQKRNGSSGSSLQGEKALGRIKSTPGASKGTAIHRKQMSGGSGRASVEGMNSPKSYGRLPREIRKRDLASKPSSVALQGGGSVPVQRNASRGSTGLAGQTVGKIL